MNKSVESKVWWPFGKAFMVPNVAFNALVHLGTYYVTNEKLRILPACLIGSIGPYTGLVMMEDIDTLMGKKQKIEDDDVYSFTKSFCKAHYPRLLLALVAFGTDLYLMANK
jgi:hypothetical protein